MRYLRNICKSCGEAQNISGFCTQKCQRDYDKARYLTAKAATPPRNINRKGSRK